MTNAAVSRADASVRPADVPAPLAQLVEAVCRRTRLWKSERAEVAAELLAHFRDGLDAGRSAEELAEGFGDPARAAALIRRAKRRNRPLWWQVLHRARLGVGVVLVLMVASYAFLAARYWLGPTPRVTRDYVAEWNAPIMAVPWENRAYPRLFEVLRALGSLPEPLREAIKQRWDAELGAVPGGETVAAWFDQKQAELERLRSVVRAEHMGFPLLAELPPDPGLEALGWRLPSPESVRASERSGTRGVPVIRTVMPAFTLLREPAMLLALDARLALRAGQGSRAAADWSAMLDLARLSRESRTVIGDLVALNILSLVAWDVRAAIAGGVAGATESDLIRVAHTMAGFPADRRAAMSMDGEFVAWLDTAQRVFTDEGGGDGRLTRQGYAEILGSISFGQTPAAPGLLERAGVALAAPLMPVVSLDRKEATRRYEHAVAAMRRAVSTPLGDEAWSRGDILHAEAALDRGGAWGQWSQFPLSVLMPALSSAALRARVALVRRDAAVVAIALEIHRRRHGSWPSSLDQLVPDLLPSVPLDEFDGRPLRYRLTDAGPLLYSVGSDRADDGGVPVLDSKGDPSEHEATRVIDRTTLEWARANPGQTSIPKGDWVLIPPMPGIPAASH
ncbi:MAG: hypothetical protein IBJ11_04100 [Phycisphaerales bacterium]|nr:hypothetical protein [Phycisphaerales bacterium]